MMSLLCPRFRPCLSPPRFFEAFSAFARRTPCQYCSSEMRVMTLRGPEFCIFGLVLQTDFKLRRMGVVVTHCAATTEKLGTSSG